MTSTGTYAGDLFVVVTILALLALMLAGLEAAANIYDWARRLWRNNKPAKHSRTTRRGW